MTTAVGSAYGTFGLDIRPFRQSVAEVRATIKQIQAEAGALAAKPARPQLIDPRATETQAAALKRLAREAQETIRNTDRLEKQLRRSADAEIAAARATGKYAEALALVDREMKIVGAGTDRYNQLLVKQAQLTRQAASESNKLAQEEQKRQNTAKGGGFLGAAGQVAGGLGLAFGAQQVVGAGVAAGQEALALRETKNALRSIAGDYRTYANVVANAREQQLLFGGSLRENIEGLSGLTITSRSTGASLESLIDLSQRLGVLSPEQGAGGARIALAEALGEGNITSLSRRFEIPKQQLEALKDATIPVEERLKVIDNFLNKVGITSAAVAGRVDKDALAYRRLNQELGDLAITAGDKLATGFADAARGLGLLLGAVNENPEAIAELKSVFSGKPATQADLERETQAVTQEQAKRSLTGNERFSGANALTQARKEIEAITNLGGQANFDAIVQQIAAIQQAGGPAAESVQQLIQAFRSGTVSGPEFQTRLGFLTQAMNDANVATTNSIPGYVANKGVLSEAEKATQELTGSIIENIQERQKQQEADQLQTEIQKALEEAAYRVATGQSTQAAETARLTALYPQLGDETEGLIDKQIRLAAATDEVTAAKARQAGQDRLAAQEAATRDDSGSIGFDSPGRRGTDDVDAVVANIQREKEERANAEKEREEARRRQTQALETTAQRVARLRKEEAEALRRNGKESAAYVNAQTERMLAEQQLQAEQERTGKKGAGSAATQQRAIDTAYNSIENRTEDHYRKLYQLQEDYQTKARRAQEDFEVDRTRNQEDFERQRRRLLAEGKIFEAQQLTEEFQREQGRAREDFDRERSRSAEDEGTRIARENADLGIDTGRVAEKAAIRGINLDGTAARTQTPVGGTGAIPGASTAVGPALAAANRRPVSIVITLNERVIAESIIDDIDALLADSGDVSFTVSPPRSATVRAFGGPPA